MACATVCHHEPAKVQRLSNNQRVFIDMQRLSRYSSDLEKQVEVGLDELKVDSRLQRADRKLQECSQLFAVVGGSVRWKDKRLKEKKSPAII